MSEQVQLNITTISSLCNTLVNKGNLEAADLRELSELINELTAVSEETAKEWPVNLLIEQLQCVWEDSIVSEEELLKSFKLLASISIWQSVEDEDIKSIDNAISAGADVNVKGKFGRTPMHRAVFNGKGEIVELLIANGGEVNAKEDSGETPLFWAALYDQHAMSEILLKNGAKDCSIQRAAFRGDINAIKEFLLSGIDINSKDKDREETPLHSAIFGISSRTLAAVKFLISEGADLNSKAPNGLSPLHYAVKYYSAQYQNESEKIIKLLIINGSNVNAHDITGETPLDKAFVSSFVEILREYGGKKAVENSIHIAAHWGDLEAVKMHLAHRVDVNLRNTDGRNKEVEWTALHFAAKYNRIEIMDYLILNGADVNVADEKFKTPLDRAKYEPEAADLLRKHGGKTGEELKSEGK
jgi:ankyrin repeat protein